MPIYALEHEVAEANTMYCSIGSASFAAMMAKAAADSVYGSRYCWGQKASGLYYGMQTFFVFDTSAIPASETIERIDLQLNISAADSVDDLAAFICNDNTVPVALPSWMSTTGSEISSAEEIGRFSATGVTGTRSLDTINSVSGIDVDRAGYTVVALLLDQMVDGEKSGGSWPRIYVMDGSLASDAVLTIHTALPSAMLGQVF